MFGKPMEYENCISEFPDLPEDYFQITDSTIIQELEDIRLKNKPINHPIQNIPASANMSLRSQFETKLDQMLQVVDNIVQPQKYPKDMPDLFENDQRNKQLTTPYKQFDYYSLAETEYDDKQATIDAFEFLKQLARQKQNSELINNVNNMNLESNTPTPLSHGGIQKQQLTKKMHLLSFQDED